MQKKSLILILVLFMVITLTGCATKPCKIMTIFNYCPLERPYCVYGRVVDLQCNPVENCKVTLIKRHYPLNASCEGKTMAEYFVAVTDKTGDYNFCFEPLEANDIWLYFDASDKGYYPQYVDLNHFMGPTIFQTPGNSPIAVDMILENAPL